MSKEVLFKSNIKKIKSLPNWERGGGGHALLWHTLRKLKINSAIEVTLEEGKKQLRRGLYRKFKNEKWRIGARKINTEGTIWQFFKVPRRGGENGKKE
ncbi:hypothetical protein LCGC14_0544280 [marine sediment metagenome]|uniref:Uncharacterized protein n=1 Tax=marine sediment metagenome TaxID=412755 RepID=A0A0F9UD71_9ZZZZ